MVSIKKRSKRRSTRQRAMIEKRVASHNRKQRKLAKKNPQWKSRVPKDPGIPNSFRGKEDMLKQIAEQRQKKQEEKQKHKEHIKALRQEKAQEAGPDELVQDEILSDEEDEEDEEDERTSILKALAENAQERGAEYEEGSEASDEDEEMDEDGSFVDDAADEFEHGATSTKEFSRKAFDKDFKKVIELSDVVLYVIDARDPQHTRSRQVEQMMLAASDEKKMILLLNKIDLVPPKVLDEWLSILRRSFSVVPVRASSGSSPGMFKHPNLSGKATGANLIKVLKAYSSSRQLKRALSVGIVGYPNVGKSSVINSMMSRNVTREPCPTGAEAGVTTSLRQVKLDSKLTLIDSPGIVFPGDEGAKKNETNLVMMNAIPIQKINDPISAAKAILSRLSRSPQLMESMTRHYNLPPLVQSDDVDLTTDFLVNVARKRGRIGRGGVPNLDSAAKVVISDWCAGRLQWWAEPEGSDKVGQNDSKEIVGGFSKEFDIEGLLNSTAGSDDAMETAS